MHTVNRGGVEMTIPLNITHHIPPRLIGHLDEEGILICDKMLKVTRLEIDEANIYSVSRRTVTQFRRSSNISRPMSR